MSRAVVLLSGGLDSTTCLSVAVKEGYEVYPLSFDYGQKHDKEILKSKEIVEYYSIKEHKIIKTGNVGGSALTDDGMEVPDYQGTSSIPTTYVPARNIIFLSYAVGYAEAIDAEVIYIGVNNVDYSGYPDCRPEFVEAFQNVIKAGTKGGINGKPIKVLTPLMNLSKAEIIKLACENNAPLHLTTSCYKGGDKACGVCDSCSLRLKGFMEAGIVDPVEYVKENIDN